MRSYPAGIAPYSERSVAERGQPPRPSSAAALARTVAKPIRTAYAGRMRVSTSDRRVCRCSENLSAPNCSVNLTARAAEYGREGRTDHDEQAGAAAGAGLEPGAERGVDADAGGGDAGALRAAGAPAATGVRGARTGG